MKANASTAGQVVAGSRTGRRAAMRITLCENMRAVPYVPFYLALAGDYWRSEGLAINHVCHLRRCKPPPSCWTAASMFHGAGRCA